MASSKTTKNAKSPKESEINAKLLALYESKKQGFNEILKKAEALNIADKLVLNLPYATQQYVDSKVKIMLVGQESNGWSFKLNDLEGSGEYKGLCGAMERTKSFQTKKPYNKPFWTFAKGIYEACHNSALTDNKPNAYFFWSNLRKICYNTPNEKDTTTTHLQPDDPLPESLQELIDKHLDSLLLNEIQIAQPDIVLFLSGPNYDGYIKQQLEGVTFQAHVDDMPSRAAARLECPSITHTAMLRLYHPNALRYRYGKDTHMDYTIPIMLPLLGVLPKDKAALLEGFVRELYEKLSETM